MPNIIALKHLQQQKRRKRVYSFKARLKIDFQLINMLWSGGWNEVNDERQYFTSFMCERSTCMIDAGKLKSQTIDV